MEKLVLLYKMLFFYMLSSFFKNKHLQKALIFPFESAGIFTSPEVKCA